MRKLATWRRERVSPLECGFSPQADSRRAVSLRFFIYAVVFVIFDVELVLILPLMYKFPLGLEFV